MNELSLFTGAGGGVLGTKLLGFKHIGYVEINDYCQRIIRQRIEDGIIDRAPIFGDIRSFISEGYAASYTGLVDVLSAGFPCQPFSVAGKQEGADDDRNMWPETISAIRIIRPQFTLLENVPGLLAHEYGRTIFRDLAESGYIPRWRILSAAELGAPHKRDRLWIVAHSNESDSRQRGCEFTEREKSGRICESEPRAPLTNTKSQSSNGGDNHREDSQCKISKPGNSGGTANVADTEGIYVQGRNDRQGKGEPGGSCWWSTEPGMGRVAHGVANRVDRLKALGNGQVSIVETAAWQLLTN